MIKKRLYFITTNIPKWSIIFIIAGPNIIIVGKNSLLGNLGPLTGHGIPLEIQHHHPQKVYQ